MKTFKIIFCLLFIFQIAIAEGETPDTSNRVVNQNVYIEFGGNGLLYTFNYEAQFQKLNGLGLRVGFGGIDKADYLSMYTFPLMVNYTFGKYENKLETGAGVVYSTNGFYGEGNSGPMKLFPTFCLGYRHQPEGKAFMYKIDWTPCIIEKNKTEKLAFIPYIFGVSLGYTF